MIPSQTGRAVWVGNGYWSRDYPAQSKLVKRLFRGHMRAAVARSFVASTGARILVADCGHRADLTKALGPMLAVHADVRVRARVRPHGHGSARGQRSAPSPRAGSTRTACRAGQPRA